MRRHRAAAVISLALLAAPWGGWAAPAKGKDAKDKDAPKWDVAAPPGAFTEVAIDTQETTWSSVDVSPDGRTLVFDMLGDLYTVPIEGGEARSLTTGIPWDTEPRYSPDGRRIAFISDRAGGDNIWVMGSDGSSPRAVSEEKKTLVHNPAWSPDGDYIAAKKDFTSTRSIAAGEIWLFHAGGGAGMNLIERPDGPRAQKNIAEPAFSRDGRYVFFSQDVTPGRVWQYNKDSTGNIFSIRRLDRKTGEVDTFVGGPGGAVRPTPSPDGKTLAFIRRTPNMVSALYLKDLQSGREWPIHDRLDRDLQETDGSHGNATAFGWTPDSRSIVFWAGGRFHRVDAATRQVSVIPVRVRTTRRVNAALRFPVAVAPDPFDVRMLRWAQMSPDGSKVLYEAMGRLWLRDARGGAARRLTTQEDHFEFHPSFSPDGRHVAYVSWDDDALGRVKVAPVTGGTGKDVTPSPGLYVEPRFSPDGRTLVYRKVAGGYLTSSEGSLEPGLYVVAAAGGAPRRVARSGRDAHFGPAADRVFFSDNVEETQLVLKSVTLDGLDERTHLKGENATELRLSPDGRWVAFAENHNAFVAPFTLTGKTVAIAGDAKAYPVRQVSRRSGEFLHWSADSGKLHWSHGATLYTRELKDAFSFLEGAPAELPEPVEAGMDLAFKAPADRPSGRIALTGGRVVTMRDAGRTREIIENGVVVVNGGRIEAVGHASQVRPPADARVFDVSGMTVLPGLVDVHAHGAEGIEEVIPRQNWEQYSNLSFGVTTVHDPSNDTSTIFAASQMQRTGRILAPRTWSTGTILYGASGPGYAASIESLDDALFHVRRLKDVGAVSVKSYQQPRRDQKQQVIEAGRQLGVMVVPEGGAKFQHNMQMIVDGHTGIEHALPLAELYDDVVQLWSRSGTGYTPTLGVAYGGLSGETYWYDRTNVWENARLMRFVPHFAVDPASIRRTKAPDLHYNHVNVARFAKRLRDRGVSVQIGAHGQREGLASHWELWMLVQGGFTPWEALRAGSIDGARYIGMDKDIGSLEAGKLADLFVVEGDPLSDIRLSENVAYTMLNGRLYDAATMDQVAPVSVKRRPFFWEKEGGDTVHPAALESMERMRERFGWRH
ncbi:MAG TPA: amidohydrolase family protein [Candidatus Polarisedimenticolia bacterium]|nr:amidohydrolase family protein [Candidatus Polarisedimenticolia bacterium]